ncbi:MAG: alpha-glucosidase C-terminal domain-containing protein, partial [Planctomycetota bacterium]
GTPNDIAAAESSGIPRRINRRKYLLEELHQSLADPDGVPRQVLRGMQRLLDTRAQQVAFHPDGPQEVIASPDPRVLCFRRTSPAGDESIVVAANCSGEAVTVPAHEIDKQPRTDLLSELRLEPGQSCTLAPFQCVWWK